MICGASTKSIRSSTAYRCSLGPVRLRRSSAYKIRSFENYFELGTLMPSLAFPKHLMSRDMSEFRISCHVCLKFEKVANNGCNIIRCVHFRAERDKTKAGVRFEYPSMDFNYANQHSREKRVQCESLKLRR